MGITSSINVEQYKKSLGETRGDQPPKLSPSSFMELRNRLTHLFDIQIATCNRCAQCDQIRRFLKVLGIMVSIKSSPNAW